MRVEANISVSAEEGKLGTKCEVKNLNSFKSVERAIKYEMERHIAALEKGEKILQETRGWDEVKQITFSQRLKEDSHDYRYFPDPDLPKLKLSEAFDMPALKAALPELPSRKRVRYSEAFGIKAEDIDNYVNNPAFARFLEETISGYDDKEKIRLASNYITSDLMGLMKNDKKNVTFPKAKDYSELVYMISGGNVSSRAAKDILAIMVESGGSPAKIAEERGLLQKSDEGELKAMLEKIITANEKVAAEYKAGKESALQFFVGQIMKETKGSANPGVAQKLIKEILAKS
jgi:aspartyl-tRNA(Asn)/glutamyl-tRNA(Gln) amidotransferase subunit B